MLAGEKQQSKKTETFVSHTVAVVWKSRSWSLDSFCLSLFCDSSKLGHGLFTLSTPSVTDNRTQADSFPFIYIDAPLGSPVTASLFPEARSSSCVLFIWMQVKLSHSRHLPATTTINMQSVSSMSTSVCLHAYELSTSCARHIVEGDLSTCY